MSLVRVEEEPRVIIAEIIESFLPFYIELEDNEKYISLLLNNLQTNLTETDEIECSAIAIFNLLVKIFDQIAKQ